MHTLTSFPLLSLLCLSLSVDAIKIPFTVRHLSARDPPSTTKRNIPIINTSNAQYSSNMTIQGVELPILLDTGSSDLWVHFPDTVPDTKDSGKTAKINYAIGQAGGKIRLATITMDNFTIQDQAYLHVEDGSTFSADLRNQGFDGLLGLGPNDGSVIREKIDNDSGDTFLNRIFESDHLTQNYITFYLNRLSSSSDEATGSFTIGEILPGFQNITNNPKLDVDTVNRLLEADQHWQALTDKNAGVLGPDGAPINVLSLVRKAPKGQFVAVFDSGFTLSQVPRQVSDQIYGRVQGAYYDTTNEWWVVPCGQYLNISFNFGGQNYPIHPLDVVDDNLNIRDPSGNRVCIGAFQPITSAFSLLGNYDMILGMSFLRNVYTLMDFGNWIDGTSSRDHPYIQIASLTDPDTARQEFIKTRLKGVDTTNDTKWQLLPKDQMQKSPISEEEKKKAYQEAVLSKWPYILLGCLVFVIGLIGLCIWKCCCKNRKARRAAAGKAHEGGSAEAGTVGRDRTSGYARDQNGSEAYLPLKEQSSRFGDSAISLPATTYQANSDHGGYSGNAGGYHNDNNSAMAPPSPGGYGPSQTFNSGQHPNYAGGGYGQPPPQYQPTNGGYHQQYQ